MAHLLVLIRTILARMRPVIRHSPRTAMEKLRLRHEQLAGTCRGALLIVGPPAGAGYMVDHALDRGHDVVAVCRGQSVGKLDA
jgi:hypothetical protein